MESENHRAPRCPLTVACILLLMGAVVLALAMCQNRAFGIFDGRMVAMGYSTGEELFNGNCRNKLTLTECIVCCQSWGLTQEEADKCIDLCIDHWNQKEPGSAAREIAKAAAVVHARDTRDYLGWNRAKTVVRAAAKSKNERIQKMATRLVTELQLNALES